MIINIGDDILKLQALGLLRKLLADKTTKKSLLWATDAYQELGSEYARDREITAEHITGRHADVIKTRARKAMEQQSARTRQHAEVFTPLWVVQRMNDYADEIWFGYPNVFFKNGMPTEEVRFFEKKKTWQTYVDSRRLEITCGEAPYLATRYDVETGEAIAPPKRSGILDRKLRVVNENAKNEADWIQWALRALQATYGYEFQGDNVLIARTNLLMTFEEAVQTRWNRKPTAREYQQAANIIAWNIWQMDGLTGTVPYCRVEEEELQFFFAPPAEEVQTQPKENTQPPCRIFDWRRDESLEFISLKNRRETK